MALSTTTNKQTFTATAGDTQFAFSIPFFDAVTIEGKKYGDIKLTRQDVAGNLTQFTPKESFTNPDVVDGEFKITPTNNDPSQGGTVTISKAAAGGETFVVERDVKYTQQYNLQEGATIDPTALNKALDRVVAQNQQQNDIFTRTVEFPVTDSPSRTYTVGSETERANKALGFDASGNVTEITLSDVPSSGGGGGGGGGGGTSTPLAADTNAGLVITNNIISAKVDNSTTQFSGGNIAVKTVGTSHLENNAVSTGKIQDDAVTNAKIADNSIQSSQLLDNAVTFAKMQDIAAHRVIGNVSGSTGNPQQVSIDHNLNTVSPAHDTLASAKGIKEYVDSLKVMNVQQSVKTNRTTTGITHTAYNDIPDLSVNITPSATSSKVLVTVHLNASTADLDDSPDGLAKTYIRLTRFDTSIILGDSGSNYERCTFAVGTDTNEVRTWSITFLDSPSTTSQVTYKLKAKESDSDATFRVNQYNAGGVGRVAAVSSITAQEVYQ